MMDDPLMSRQRGDGLRHRHDYEAVAIDAHGYVLKADGRDQFFYVAQRCKACGRLAHVNMLLDLDGPPEGLPLYEVADFMELIGMKALPEELAKPR